MHIREVHPIVKKRKRNIKFKLVNLIKKNIYIKYKNIILLVHHLQRKSIDSHEYKRRLNNMPLSICILKVTDYQTFKIINYGEYNWIST